MKRQLAVIGLILCAAQVSVANTRKAQALNDLRNAEALAPLTYSEALEKAALVHAADMADNGIFSHDGSDGSDVAKRVSAVGYGWCVVAENIAKGHRDLTEVLLAWQNSPGHRANMMSREVTEFAVVQGRDLIWVMVLAAPGC